MFNQWKIISIVEIIYYLLIIIISAYPTKKIFTRPHVAGHTNPKTELKPFMIRYLILLGSKVVAGMLLIPYINQLNQQIENNGATTPDTNIFIASMVLNSIGFGFINLLNLYIVQYIDKIQLFLVEGEVSESDLKIPGGRILYLVLPIDAFLEFLKGHYKVAFSSLLGKLSFYAVIINIVAFSRFGGQLTVDYRQTTKRLLIVASLIYIVTICLIIGYIIYKVFFESRLANGIYAGYIRKLLVFNLLICPFLLVRTIYNICAAFTMNIHGSFAVNASRFTFLFGDWRIYVGMLFIMECICVLWMCCILWEIYLNSYKHEDALAAEAIESKLEDFN